MKWGAFQLHRLSGGFLWLDGGAMFGVVPKPLWEKKAPPDEKNRIRLATNCLLIRTGEKNLLVDTGCGGKYSEKQKEIYRIEQECRLLEELRRCGVAPEQIDFVINTHLHFDHCGGNTRRAGDAVVPTFPNATYIVRREEYEAASRPNERTRASYFQHNWKPVEEEGRLKIVERDEEVVPGVSLVHTPGHTEGHQSVRVESEGAVLFYLADLCPTAAHVPLPWVMAYDVFPLTTMETRRQIYPQAIRERWLMFFEHDPAIVAGYLIEEDGRVKVQPFDWEE